MGKYASEVVKQAKSWLGKKESDGSHKEIIDVYNSHEPLARGYKVKYTDAWCSTFVSAVAIKLGYTDIIPTECGCEKHIELFKKIGSWIENENRVPNIGDIIFYDWDDGGSGDAKGWSDHVGIVEKVVGDIITVIEGNRNGVVARRDIKVNGRYIRGYGVPKYDDENETDKNKPETNNDKKKIAEDGMWGEETTRRAQEVFGTTVDGIVSNQYLSEKGRNEGLFAFEWLENPNSCGSELIKAIQKKVGARVDGFIGVETITKMQKWLGTTQDGFVSNPSDMVRAFQVWLNKQ